SITTWRLAGSGIARDGRLGSFQRGIRVFQDFFVDIQLPVQLTQNDEISIPVDIFNYLNDPQTIVLEAAEADWFEFVDEEPTKSVEAGANQVLSASYRIRVLTPGRHTMTITAKGSALADAVQRTVQVEPDGVRTEIVANAKLVGEANEVIAIPQNAIAGGNDLYVKLYPGGFSQVVEGMDSIFRMPNGCFEQASSTTYPNVLVLNYLRETKHSSPDIEMKALDYIATGYQRLLSFEIDSGGFDWFGRPPANEVLTAYGLHEFIDMAQVYDVDANLITRTRAWLMSRVQSDGTWKGEDLRHQHVNDASSADRTIRQTAYVAWSLARTGNLQGLDNSIAFLETQADTDDPYVLALVANALFACRRDRSASDVVDRLSDMAQQSDTGLFRTSKDMGLTYSHGNSLTVETTALVVQAMVNTESHPRLIALALDWISSQRDARGTWNSTQATVQAMRALLMSDGGGKITQDTKIQIMVNGQPAKTLTITEETGDVFHLVSLTDHVQQGDNAISLSVDNDALLSYQIVGVHYVPRPEALVLKDKILEISTNYATHELTIDDLLTVQVTLKYNRPENAPMTLVDLGIPPGFEIQSASFRRLVDTGVITKFEPKGQQVSLYFDTIPGDGKTTRFEYQLRAKYPVKVQTPTTVAYQYYEPEIRDTTEVEVLRIR
ncbi:MAG: alpha-2-macroglobulin family protein, partial [Planctomycetaceae bacterium]